jgi:hypothetical protein
MTINGDEIDQALNNGVSDQETIKRMSIEIGELHRMISDEPKNLTLLPAVFQRFWECCVNLMEKSDFKFLVRYIESGEKQLSISNKKLEIIKKCLASEYSKEHEFPVRMDCMTDNERKIANMCCELTGSIAFCLKLIDDETIGSEQVLNTGTTGCNPQ